MIWLFWLYVAHFIGDYPLQTNWIYHYKLKNPLGGVFHALGIGFSLALCFAPVWYKPEVWVAISSIVVAHYLQDEVKVTSPFLKKHYWLGYVLDQSSHISFSSLIWYAVLYERGITPQFGEQWYMSLWVPIYILGLLLVSYVWETSRFILISKGQHIPFVKRWDAMIIRGVVYSIVFGVIFFFMQ